jgi:hypothetical protein
MASNTGLFAKHDEKQQQQQQSHQHGGSSLAVEMLSSSTLAPLSSTLAPTQSSTGPLDTVYSDTISQRQLDLSVGDRSATPGYLQPAGDSSSSLSQDQQRQISSGSAPCDSAPLAARAAPDPGPSSAFGAAAAAGSDDGTLELPPLAREMGVSCASLIRLFRADADAEYEQPVWMVVNLQV